MANLQLFPEDLVAQFRKLTAAEADTSWAHTKMLMIDVGEGTTELLTALVGSSTVNGAPMAPTRDGLSFMTTVTKVPTSPGAIPPISPVAVQPATVQALNEQAVLALLARGSYFIAPLRKRSLDGQSWAERVSVGRARNSDIVLRQESVSKFHAYFETDEDGGLWLTDAGSTNRTRVAGEVLQPNVPQRVVSGAQIQFGKVKCVLCPPQLVWNVVLRHVRN